MSSKRLPYAMLPRRIEPFHAATAPTLVQLNDFALLVKQRKFPRVVEIILSPADSQGTAVHLVARIAAVLRVSACHVENDLLVKSIQETLFCSGKCDIDQGRFGRNLETFVRDTGCKGLIQVFMQLHLSNVLMKQIRDSSRVPDDLQTLERLPSAVDALCWQAVKVTSEGWQKWLHFDENIARQMLRDLRAEMTAIMAAPATPLPKSA